MREDLKILEKIDQYLTGQMNASEVQTFEADIQNNPDLRNQVDNQQLIIQAAKRKVLSSQISAAANGGGGFFKLNWTLGLGLIFLLVGFVIYTQLDLDKPKTAQDYEIGVSSNPVDSKSVDSINLVKNDLISDVDILSDDSQTTQLFQTKEKVKNKAPNDKQKSVGEDKSKQSDFYDFNGLQCWVKPDIQIFEIDANKTETIEGLEGTLLIVPKESFLDKNGNKVNGKVQFELVEAYELSDMLLYNLTTTSNGSALETGGMFYTNATQNGKQLTVDPNKPMMIQVPCVEEKEDMLAFESEIDTDGNINWKNPKPLEQFLTKVDIKLLDFLPTGFEDEVYANMPIVGVEKANDAVVDSLYYSFIWKDSHLISKNYTYSKGKNEGQGMLERGYEEGQYKIIIPDFYPNCGINPKSVKIIKESMGYENSFIATKEFEERIKELHKLECGQEMLDVYLNNLDKDLWYSDSIVAVSIPLIVEGKLSKISVSDASLTNNELKNVFLGFYNERKTKIRDADVYSQALTTYYNNKKKEYKGAWQSIRNKSNSQIKVEIDNVAETKKSNKNSTASQNNPITSVNVSRGRNYTLAWASFGWANIDAYLHMLSKGSKDCEVTCTNSDNKGKMKLYQWLGAISTLTPVVVNQFKGIVKFPKKNSPGAEQMKNTYTIAISRADEKWFFGLTNYNPYQMDEVDIELEEMSFAFLKSRLKELGGTTPLISRLEQEAEKLRKQKELKAQNQKEEVFINKLVKLCFSCYSDNYMGKYWRGDGNYGNSGWPYNNVSQDAFYDGGEKAIQKYVDLRFKFPFLYNKDISNRKFMINLWVEPNGNVQRASVISGVSWSLDRKMKKLLEKMSNWNPALSNGSPVDGNVTIEVELPLDE